MRRLDGGAWPAPKPATLKARWADLFGTEEEDAQMGEATEQVAEAPIGTCKAGEPEGPAQGKQKPSPAQKELVVTLHKQILEEEAAEKAQRPPGWRLQAATDAVAAKTTVAEDARALAT